MLKMDLSIMKAWKSVEMRYHPTTILFKRWMIIHPLGRLRHPLQMRLRRRQRLQPRLNVHTIPMIRTRLTRTLRKTLCTLSGCPRITMLWMLWRRVNLEVQIAGLKARLKLCLDKLQDRPQAKTSGLQATLKTQTLQRLRRETPPITVSCSSLTRTRGALAWVLLVAQP